MSDTAHIKSRRLVRRFSASLPVSALAACLVACLVACSGGSSDERDDEKSTSSEEAQGEPVADTEADTEDEAAASTPAAAFDPDALVRRLDRLTAGTDAHVLRSGLAEDAAPASLSLDALEARFESVQSRLHEMRSSPPAEDVSR